MSGYYTPGKIRILLECYCDYLSCGKVPPLAHDSSGWHLADNMEQVKQRQRTPSDGLEASRIIADLKSAMEPRPPERGGQWKELTRGERIFLLSRFFGDFSDQQAADMAGIARDRTHRTVYEATDKMALNLGYGLTSVYMPALVSTGYSLLANT